MTLPFRNIRDVLGLHAKVSPHKNCLIAYEVHQQRTEISYLEFVGKSHQVANFLFEDLDIQRGDTIAIASPNHEHSLLLYFAAWVIGASVVSLDLTQDKKAIHDILEDGQTRILFVHHKYLDEYTSLADSVEGIIQIAGDRRDHYLRFEDLAANRPTTFLGDESGAKGADIPMTGGNEQTARLTDIALITFDNGNVVRRTQGDLLENATRLASASALTGNQNTLAILPLHQNFVESLMAPLVTGATIILSDTFSADLFWQLIVREHIHTVVLRTSELQQLIASARENIASGRMRFGGRVIQQDIKHFRHILTTDTALGSQLACEYEDIFGLPLITAYQHPQTHDLLTLLPITLSWTQHQAWLHGYNTPSIGVEISDIKLRIIDTQGNTVAENQRGEIALKAQDGTWQEIGQQGYFLRDEQNKMFYFLVE